MTMKIGWNGTVVDAEEVKVSVFDHGFLYGVGLFETFRTYGGKPFLFAEHLHRLKFACAELAIAYEPDPRGLDRLIRDLLIANGLDEAYVRLSISAGEGEVGLPGPSYDRPNEIIYVKPLPAYPAELYTQGKPLQLLRTRRNTPEGDVRLKSFHYMNNIMARRELLQYTWSGGAEGLMLNEAGYAAEGIVSNIFLVRRGKLMTPAVNTGILPGITRAFVLDMANRLGIHTEEGHYVWQDLLEADELFVTNSIQEIVPITKCFELDGLCTVIGQGVAGGLTEQLIEHYRYTVRG